MAFKIMRPYQARDWKEEVNQNLRDCGLYVVSYELWQREHRSFLGNLFRKGDHPAVAAFDFAKHVGAI